MHNTRQPYSQAASRMISNTLFFVYVYSWWIWSEYYSNTIIPVIHGRWMEIDGDGRWTKTDRPSQGRIQTTDH